MLSVFVLKDSGIRTYQQYNWAHRLPVGGEWILVIKSIPKPSKFASRSWGLKTCRIRNGQVLWQRCTRHAFNAWPLRKRWRCGHKIVTGKMLSTWPSFKTSNNHLGAEKLSCLSILHCTIKKNDIKFRNEKKNGKKSVAIFFFTTNHNPTAEVEHRVSRALQNIDLKQNIVFIEAWSTDPIRSSGSAERILDFQTIKSARNQESHKFASWSQTIRSAVKTMALGPLWQGICRFYCCCFSNAVLRKRCIKMTTDSFDRCEPSLSPFSYSTDVQSQSFIVPVIRVEKAKQISGQTLPAGK